ncbi:MAG: hypothetical protein ACRDHN_18140 [Thermomicrobiales bacterium]
MAAEAAIETTEAILVRGTIVSKHPIDTERTLWTIRLQMPPGGGLPFWTNPGLTVIYVESGAIGFTAVTGNVWLTSGTESIVKERAFTGAEYLLKPGDTASFGPSAQQSIRNPITRPSIFMLTMVTPKGATPYDGLTTSEGYPIVFAE